jgi:hypothetical protein
MNRTQGLKRSILFFGAQAFIALCFGSSAVAGGDLINNGGGIAEKNVLYAYDKLDNFVHLCLKSDVCKLTENQKVILQKISDGLPEEKKSVKQITMASERRTPGFFMIDGNVRVAKTGSAVGSSIFINVDLLYTKDENGNIEPVTVPEAVAILIHELGHHYGNYSHEELDLVAIKVSLLLQKELITTPLLPWSNEVSVAVFNPKKLTAFPMLILNVGDEIIDVSQLYENTVRCNYLSLPIPIVRAPDIVLLSNKPIASTLYNIHWEKISETPHHLRIKLQGNISNKCAYSNDYKIRDNTYQLAMEYTLKRESDRWVLSRSSLKMNQFKDAWWKIINLP